jgi:hypothetical protein
MGTAVRTYATITGPGGGLRFLDRGQRVLLTLIPRAV